MNILKDSKLIREKIELKEYDHKFVVYLLTFGILCDKMIKYIICE